jgi:hypothetical protein
MLVLDGFSSIFGRISRFDFGEKAIGLICGYFKLLRDWYMMDVGQGFWIFLWWSYGWEGLC